MIRTRRGWEVDAGPADAEGNKRTYLLARVQEFEVLAERFSDPDDLDVLLARQRTLTRVELIVPHERRWAVEKYAECADVVEENPRTVRLSAYLLEPVRFRVGLILLDGGVRAKVIDPIGLAEAGRELARILLATTRTRFLPTDRLPLSAKLSSCGRPTRRVGVATRQFRVQRQSGGSAAIRRSPGRGRRSSPAPATGRSRSGRRY